MGPTRLFMPSQGQAPSKINSARQTKKALSPDMPGAVAAQARRDTPARARITTSHRCSFTARQARPGRDNKSHHKASQHKGRAHRAPRQNRKRP